MAAHDARSTTGNAQRLTALQRAVLVAGCAANGLVFLDQTAVPVALQAIRRDLNATSAELHLVVGSYLIVLAALMPAAARLADRYGRRKVFLTGVALFGIAGLALAAAPSIEVLIALRAVQGAGAALSVPLALSNVTAMLPEQRRGWAVGALATGGTVFLAVGPLVGGAVVDSWSWRWVFLLNVPLVATALALAMRWLPESRETEPSPLDTVGLALLVAGLGALVTGLLQIGDDGVAATSAGLVTGGLVLLVAFVVAERRAAHPLVELRLLRVPAVAGSLSAMFAMQFAILAVTVELVLYLQRALGYGAFTAGLLLLPTLIGTPSLSTTVGRLADHRGARGFVTTGLTFATVALTWIALFCRDGWILLLLPGLLLFSASRPLVLTPATSAAMRSLPDRAHHQVSALATEARQLGAVFGVAVSAFIVGSDDTAQGFQWAMLATAGLCSTAAVVARASIGAGRLRASRTYPG